MGKFPKIILLLLIVTLLKNVVFSSIVPIWHFPDEQAHFGQVAYIAKLGKTEIYGNNLTREIYESENLLGTLRDKNGNNKFTFHPDYKIEYTNSEVGKYENQIKSLPKEYRTQLTISEATVYPPLFYIISTIPYKVFYGSDLMTRVYLVRLVSIVFGVLTIFVSWLIAKEIFEKDKLMQVVLPTLISFQPMFSFVSSGINSDNLMNLLFTAVIYLGVLIIKKGLRFRYGVYLIGLLILGYFTKPQFILEIPVIVVAVIELFAKSRINKKLLTLILFFFLTGILISFNNLGNYFSGNTYQITFFEHLKNTIIHSTKEVIPWYWGVFDWLGVVLPIGVIRTLNRIMILAGIGLLIKIILIIKNKNYKENLIFTFLLFTSIIYFLGITFFDYLYIKSNYGISVGIQGRYFFPTIIAHMYLLVVGLLQLVPGKFKRALTWLKKLFVFGMVVLNFLALEIIAKTYYDLSDFNNFINQASQYKPDFVKYPFFLTYFILYLVVLAIFTFNFLKIKNND